MIDRESPKSEPQSLVRIYAKTKALIQEVVIERTHREKRVVTEIEVADPILRRGLKKEKRKLGIV